MRPLQTDFSDNIQSAPILPEYPRPTMVRDSYLNLNGLWEYAVCREDTAPRQYDGQILVPFSPECALSGVRHTLTPDETLWYRRMLPPVCLSGHERLLLHFGAADQTAQVFVNRHSAGAHTGGYLPFTLDITDFMHVGENELTVRIKDVTDASWHSRGKQSLHPRGMFYTAQSGLWQTVWAEVVPDNHITQIEYFPDYDHSRIGIRAHTRQSVKMTCTIAQPNKQPHSFLGMTGETLWIALPNFRSWSPEDPYLYPVAIQTEADRVTGYFAMRKCDIQTDHAGIRRFFLNGKPYFQAGVLDQGYWPESLYTAPSDAALAADISRMKDLGFNMLRKHAKIEPERFYYHCDRLGMLVWQDMVNGGSPYKHWFVTYLATLLNWCHIPYHDGKAHRKLLSRTDLEGHTEFLQELEETVLFLRNHPCIVAWVPFNEGWGQFDALKAADRIRELDPSRLIDHASGWFDQKGGDIASLHYYFLTLPCRPEQKRALALTEFGGYSCQIPNHSACDKIYGYKTFQTTEALTRGYAKLIEKTILPAVRKGIGATVYTQLSDVEEETNGIYTYDRKICKLDAQTVRRLNQALKDAVTQNPNMPKSRIPPA